MYRSVMCSSVMYCSMIERIYNGIKELKGNMFFWVKGMIYLLLIFVLCFSRNKVLVLFFFFIVLCSSVRFLVVCILIFVFVLSSLLVIDICFVYRVSFKGVWFLLFDKLKFGIMGRWLFLLRLFMKWICNVFNDRFDEKFKWIFYYM